jgi:hypothetical protein
VITHASPLFINMKSDIIDQPAHYTYSQYQSIDVIREWTKHSAEPFAVGAALKYICRAGAPPEARKGPELEDLLKARRMLEMAINAIAKEALPIGPPQSKDCHS